MSLPKPTHEQLLEAISALDGRLCSLGDNISCCRNCYEVGDTKIFCCEKCGLWRCDECRPTHLAMRDRLAAYLCLELGMAYPVMDIFLHTSHVDVFFCDSCDSTFCTRCEVMHKNGGVVYHIDGQKLVETYYECGKCHSSQ
jgi:hypothetical protein